MGTGLFWRRMSFIGWQMRQYMICRKNLRKEYGDSVQMDGYDIDYGNQVLTLKLGSLGTYVINNQTPNRQIWLSSPVSGPARFDWDVATKSWIYRRTKANLLQLLEEELQQLCAKPIDLS
uniref:ferroxidase n=2 Tax=Elaeis guineensis var. tenera TaxID=51953 RepID=A0A8N4EXL7_ELAGV|nr:frataxin, mitochondrial isoform X1 [Elaeis guineensis]